MDRLGFLFVCVCFLLLSSVGGAGASYIIGQCSTTTTEIHAQPQDFLIREENKMECIILDWILGLKIKT